MPWRFRRSAKIAPGVRLNLGKKGVSVSLGGRGLKATFGHGKVRGTVGLPGTGLSYTKSKSISPMTAPNSERSKSACCPLTLLLLPFNLLKRLSKNGRPGQGS
jgi:hypothetical protein